MKHGKVFYYKQPHASVGSPGVAGVVETDSSDTDVPGDDDFLVEWEECSEFEKGYGPKATWTKDKEYNFESGKVVAAAPRSYQPADTLKPQNDMVGNHPFPCMPCINHQEAHREKLNGEANGINITKMFNTAVARRVGRKEMTENDDARKSMRKEWLGQHEAGVYAFSVVREYDDVVAEAKKAGKEVHMARIHGICVEKNFQLPKGHPNRKFKGRGCAIWKPGQEPVLGSRILPGPWELSRNF